jgi:site-specific recombinase XerD
LGVIVAPEVEGCARLMLVSGVRHLDPQRAVFDAMVAGWARQQQARLLAQNAISGNVVAVRRFATFTNDYPWVWTPADVEEFFAELRSRGFALSTLRAHQVRLRLFGEFIIDPRYGWAEECWQRFGNHPVQVCHESNTAVHAADYEGGPRRRPLTREELQALFDHADAQVGQAVSDGRKGAVAAFRDAVVLKVVYAWGLRRREAVMLDVADWHPNPAAAKLGGFGALHVRYGKAMRGSAPRRRTVLSVFPWAVDAVAQYLEAVRPLLAGEKEPAMWPTERSSRLSGRALNDRMAAYRSALGLPQELDLHALRHSYVTHLIEDGFPERFVSEQVGHAYAATTALYTNVSDDFKNRTLAKALTRAFTPDTATGRV